MPHTKPSLETRYYDSDDEPCRVHRDENGTLKGDAYRRGKGIVSICPADIIDNGYPIGRARYEELVRERTEISDALNPPISE